MGPRVHFGLVFHTEGLVNEKVVRRLEEFAAGLKGRFRPALATVTPFCPQYHVDPLLDKARRDFSPVVSEGAEKRFSETIGSLAESFDIGYHGHFFELSNSRFRPAFDPEAISRQFTQECNYMKAIGHSPWVYAGGWWYISPSMGPLFERFGFRLDTTVNDLHADSFDRAQPVPRGVLGTPSWLFRGVVEIQSVRAFGNILGKRVSADGRERFLVLTLHDYDLLDPLLGPALKTVGRLADKGVMLSTEALYESAREELEKAPRAGNLR